MSVPDKGDMQNVQSSGSRGTGLKTTGLDVSLLLMKMIVYWASAIYFQFHSRQFARWISEEILSYSSAVTLVALALAYLTIYIYIYAFSRRFYPKRLTLHSSYSFTFYQLLLSLGIEPMILALLAPCSTIWATGKTITCHLAYKMLSLVYYLNILGGVKLACGFNNQMRLHLSSFVWNAAQTTFWSGLSDRIYIRLECVSEGIYTWSFHDRIDIRSEKNAWSDQVAPTHHV